MNEAENTIESILAVSIVGGILCLMGLVVIGMLVYAVIERDGELGFMAGGVLLVAAMLGVALWWGMYPWKAEYHQWRPISGVVDKVDSRLMSTGAGDGSMEDKFVVRSQGNPQQYGVLDTRAAGVKVGDTLSITCVKRWQWSGTHGYDCNFVSLEAK